MFIEHCSAQAYMSRFAENLEGIMSGERIHLWTCREYLEREKILDVCHRVQKLLDGTVMLPVLAEKLTEQHLQKLRESLPPEMTYTLTWVQVSKALASPIESRQGFTIPGSHAPYPVSVNGCFLLGHWHANPP